MKSVEIKNWTDFRSWVDADRQVLPVYWRSQKDPAWPLASSFERQFLRLNGGWKVGASNVYPYDGRFEREGKKTWEPGFYAAMSDRYLDAFRRASSGLRGIAPAVLETDQWWSLGRHHGLVTPLLDWTESPYIAAFFPLSELLQEMGAAGGGISFGGRAVAVFRLFHNEHLEGDGLRVVRPLVDELGRMHDNEACLPGWTRTPSLSLRGFATRQAEATCSPSSSSRTRLSSTAVGISRRMELIPVSSFQTWMALLSTQILSGTYYDETAG